MSNRMNQAPFVLEQVQRMYRLMLEANLPAALTSVQDYWTAEGAPAVLPPIAEWHSGNIPDESLLAVLQRLPAITVEAIAATPTADEIVLLVDSVVITVYTLGQSVDEADLLTHRYAQALAICVLEQRPAGNVVGIAEVLPISIGVGETFDAARGSFLKRAALRVPVRVGGRL